MRAEDRRVVDLKVAGMDDHAGWRSDRKRGRIRDAVVRADEFHLEIPRLHNVAVRHDMPFGTVRQAVLRQLFIDDRHREPRGVDRDVQLRQDVRQRADVVLMAVSNEKTADTFPVPDKIGHVRYDQVHPRHILRGKSQSAVHHDDAAGVFKRRDIHADLFQTAERDDIDLPLGNIVVIASYFVFM